jgi:hypothetical protein
MASLSEHHSQFRKLISFFIEKLGGTMSNNDAPCYLYQIPIELVNMIFNWLDKTGKLVGTLLDKKLRELCLALVAKTNIYYCECEARPNQTRDMNKPKNPIHYRIALAAAFAGHANVLTWALNKGFEPDSLLVIRAVRGGHHELIDLLLARSTHPDKEEHLINDQHMDIFLASGQSGSLDTVEWAIQLAKNLHVECSDYALGIMEGMAREARFELLTWAKENFNNYDDILHDDILHDVIRHTDNLSTCIWYYSTHAFFIYDIEEHIELGHIAIAEWMIDFFKDPMVLESVAETAAHCGNLYLLQKLRDRGCSMSYIYDIAISQGHLEIARWILKEGLPFHAQTALMCASSYGELEMWKWAWELYPVVDQYNMMLLGYSYKNNLDCIKFAVECGHVIDREVLLVSINANILEKVRWPFEQVNSDILNSTEYLNRAFSTNASPKIIEFLLKLGCPKQELYEVVRMTPELETLSKEYGFTLKVLSFE